MAVDQNSLHNLEKGKKFAPGDPRINRKGRPPGKPNRKTLFKEWLEMETTGKDPAGNKVQLPLADKVVLAAIYKACKGNTAAINIVLDGMFGKLSNHPDPTPEPQKPTIDWSTYTEEEIIQLNALLEK